MKTLKILLPVLLVLFIVIISTAQIFKIADYRDRTEAFLAGLLQGEIDKSCDEFIGDSAVSIYPTRAEFYSGQIRGTLDIHGGLIDYEFISEQVLGDSVAKLTYVIKARQIPLVADFYFYKPANDWKLLTINFSSAINFWPASL